MAADLSQPRQPKTPGTPLITPIANSAPKMTSQPMAGNPTGWVPKPRTGFQLEQHKFPPLGSSATSRVHTSQPIGISRFPQALPGFSVIPQQPSPLRQQSPMMFLQQPSGISLGRGLFNTYHVTGTFEAGRQQYPGNSGLSSHMDGLYLDERNFASVLCRSREHTARSAAAVASFKVVSFPCNVVDICLPAPKIK